MALAMVHAPTVAEQLQSAKEDYIEWRDLHAYEETRRVKIAEDLEKAQAAYEDLLFNADADYGDESCVDVTEEERYKIQIERLRRNLEWADRHVEEALNKSTAAYFKWDDLKRLHQPEGEHVWVQDVEYDMVLDELQKKAQACFEKHGNIGAMMEDIDAEDPQ